MPDLKKKRGRKPTGRQNPRARAWQEASDGVWHAQPGMEPFDDTSCGPLRAIRYRWQVPVCAYHMGLGLLWHDPFTVEGGAERWSSTIMRTYMMVRGLMPAETPPFKVSEAAVALLAELTAEPCELTNKLSVMWESRQYRQGLKGRHIAARAAALFRAIGVPEDAYESAVARKAEFALLAREETVWVAGRMLTPLDAAEELCAALTFAAGEGVCSRISLMTVSGKPSGKLADLRRRGFLFCAARPGYSKSRGVAAGDFEVPSIATEYHRPAFATAFANAMLAEATPEATEFRTALDVHFALPWLRRNPAEPVLVSTMLFKRVVPACALADWYEGLRKTPLMEASAPLKRLVGP